MNRAAQEVARLRALQRQIIARGGPGPEDMKQWEWASQALDDAELNLRAGLGFWWLIVPLAGLFSILAIKLGLAAEQGAEDVVQGAAQELNPQTPGSAANIAKWVLIGWLGLKLLKNVRGKARGRHRRRASTKRKALPPLRKVA